jgi:hypothetical protein
MMSYSQNITPLETATVADARAALLATVGALVLEQGATRESLSEAAAAAQWARTWLPSQLDGLLLELAAVFALLSFFAGNDGVCVGIARSLG